VQITSHSDAFSQVTEGTGLISGLPLVSLLLGFIFFLRFLGQLVFPTSHLGFHTLLFCDQSLMDTFVQLFQVQTLTHTLPASSAAFIVSVAAA
jgi:hypothetical protein